MVGLVASYLGIQAAVGWFVGWLLGESPLPSEYYPGVVARLLCCWLVRCLGRWLLGW